MTFDNDLKQIAVCQMFILSKSYVLCPFVLRQIQLIKNFTHKILVEPNNCYNESV